MIAGPAATFRRTAIAARARGFLEFHHLQPYGARGKPTVDNISLRCRAHNAYEAEVFYGPLKEYGGVRLAVGSPNDAERVRQHTFSFRNEKAGAVSP